MDPFIGQVQMWANNFIPRGWATCQGALIPISQNTSLFSLVGIAYGGDGRTTFALPRLQGHAVMSWGSGPGLYSYAYGGNGGFHEVAIFEEQMPNHGHGTIQGQKGNKANRGFVAADVVPARRETDSGTVVASYADYNSVSAVDMHDTMISKVGAGGAHENRQPFLALQFCIALTGVYPTRN